MFTMEKSFIERTGQDAELNRVHGAWQGTTVLLFAFKAKVKVRRQWQGTSRVMWRMFVRGGGGGAAEEDTGWVRKEERGEN